MKSTLKKKSKKTMALILSIAMLAAMLPTFVMKASGSTYPTELVNGGFEYPSLNGLISDYNWWYDFFPFNITGFNAGNYRRGNSTGTISSYDSSKFGWNTTATGAARYCEVGGSWDVNSWGVNFIPEGNQFIELNAITRTATYQDLATTPGQVIYWSLYQGGVWYTNKTNIDNTMTVRIGTQAQLPDATIIQLTGTNYDQQWTKRTIYNIDSMTEVASLPAAYTGKDSNKKQLYTEAKRWTKYEGVYVVPEGQTVTRFAFASLSTADPESGNMLDGIVFRTATSQDKAIDSNPPVIGTPSGNPTSLTNIDPTISFTVTDNESAISSVKVSGSVSGDKAVSNTAGTYSFTATQNETYTITATDNCGNTTTLQVTVTCINEKTINYGVTGANGSVSATVDNVAVSSGAAVLVGKDLVFTATPSSGYRVKQWKLGGTTVSGNTTNTFTLSNISADSTVMVEFEAVPDIVSINASTNNTQNCISLDWTNASPNSSDYHYMVTKKDVAAGGTAQTIPLKSSIKVLNIYPGDTPGATSDPGYAQSGYPTDASAGVKKWMEQDGFGKGNISVTSVYIGDFNNSPGTYLTKDANTGLYNYDVVFAGCWDSNNNSADLTQQAKDLVQAFINSGGGYLAGHDTAIPSIWGMPNLSSLVQTNLNMQLDENIPHYGREDIPGNIDIAIVKNGSLINYPWALSGSTLSVPASHSTNQFAMGDVWMRYSTNPLGTSEITTLNGCSGTNNFYLSTWNNCAMIQTGHSNGTATDDEKKILANTLLYLAQISTGTSFEDHTAQDVTKPNSVSATSISVNLGTDNRVKITYAAPADVGNTYEYQLKAIDKADTVTTSEAISATITSGIKGYSIVVDNNPDTVLLDSIDTTDLSYTTGQLASGTWYVHIKAIDFAGNASSTTNLKFNVPPASTYIVTYNGNGSDGGDVPTDSTQYKKDTYARVMSKGTLTKAGNTFIGWNTLPIGDASSYKVNDTFAITGNVTLYAQWAAIDRAQTPVFTASNVRGMEAVTKGAATITLSVTVAPVTDGGTITYQWYKSATNSTSGATLIDLATDPSYTPVNDTVGTTYYYVVVKNTLADVTKTATNTSSMKEVVVYLTAADSYNILSSVGTSLSNITLSNPSATQYQNYITAISAENGYSLPNSITVTMGGKILVPGVDYIYSETSSTTGTVTVYNVTGELSITVAGVLIPTRNYTITFNSEGGSDVAAINGTCGAAIVLPTPTKTGYIFDGWYRDGGFATSYISAVIGNEDITLYAKWEQNTYDITGNVRNEETNSTVSGATVKLMSGSRQIALTITDLSGDFRISGVPAGTYNIVISKGDQTITLTITVKDSNIATGSVTLPKGNKNSVVEVRQDTPDIVVDKLNDFFNSSKFTQDDSNVVDAGGTVEIRLLAEKKDESGDNAAANADSLETSAGGNGNTLGIFLNLAITKVITPAGGAAEQPTLIYQLSDLLTIDIPLPTELQGKSGYIVYRYHDGEVQTITGTLNADGEYIEVSAGGKSIKLHTKKFSTYAVGYTTPYTPPTGTTGSSSSNGVVSSSITAEPSEGGKITVNDDKKSADIAPDDGYVIADVLVDGNSIGATEKYTFLDSSTHKIAAVFVKKIALPYYIKDGGKVYIGFSAIAGNLYKYIAPAGTAVEFGDNPKNFKDNTVAWSKPSIDFVTEREIFLGTELDKFGPDEGMTRAMFVAVIGRLYERSYGSVSGTSTFLDVDAKAYYAKYVGWANENGIIKGIGWNKFAPNYRVTREQMAVIMLKLAAFMKKAEVNGVSLAFADSASISSWAIDGAEYCQETKVIQGRTGGNFAPRESATRAEASAVLQRFIVEMLK